MKLFKIKSFQISKGSFSQNLSSNEFSESELDLSKKESMSVSSISSANEKTQKGLSYASAIPISEISAESSSEKINKFTNTIKTPYAYLNKNQSRKRQQQQITWTKLEEEILFASGKTQIKKKWNSIAKKLQNKTPSQCYYHFNSCNPQIKRRNWTAEEDKKILQLYKIHGRKWEEIARNLKNRTGKQVRDRFLNRLDNSVKHSKFSEAEDRLIFSLYLKYGACWSKISSVLKTRSSDMIKSRFYSSIKKRFLENATSFSNEISNDACKENENEILFDVNLNAKTTENYSCLNYFGLNLYESKISFLRKAANNGKNNNEDAKVDFGNFRKNESNLNFPQAPENVKCFDYYEDIKIKDGNSVECAITAHDLFDFENHCGYEVKEEVDFAVADEENSKKDYFNADNNDKNNSNCYYDKKNVNFVNDCINSVATHFNSKKNSFEFENENLNLLNMKQEEGGDMKFRVKFDKNACENVKAKKEENNNNNKINSNSFSNANKIQSPNQNNIFNNFSGCFFSILSQKSNTNNSQFNDRNYYSKNNFHTYLSACNNQNIIKNKCIFNSKNIQESKINKENNQVNDNYCEAMTLTETDYSNEDCEN